MYMYRSIFNKKIPANLVYVYINNSHNYQKLNKHIVHTKSDVEFLFCFYHWTFHLAPKFYYRILLPIDQPIIMLMLFKKYTHTFHCFQGKY